MSFDDVRDCFEPVVREVFGFELRPGVAEGYRQLAAWGFPASFGSLIYTTGDGFLAGVAGLVGLVAFFGAMRAVMPFFVALETRWATRKFSDDGPDAELPVPGYEWTVEDPTYAAQIVFSERAGDDPTPFKEIAREHLNGEWSAEWCRQTYRRGQGVGATKP